jgi:hypothetical protein
VTSKFLILNIECDDETLFWSNADGWVDRSSATSFSHQEMKEFNLPVGGMWIATEGEANKLDCRVSALAELRNIEQNT